MLMVSAEAFAKKEACSIMTKTRNDLAKNNNKLEDLRPIEFINKLLILKIILSVKENTWRIMCGIDTENQIIGCYFQQC